MVEGYDIDQVRRVGAYRPQHGEIAGDEGSAKWTSSRPASRGAVKAAGWRMRSPSLIRRRNLTTEDTARSQRKKKRKKKRAKQAQAVAASPRTESKAASSRDPPWLKILRARSSAPCPPRSIPCWPLPSTSPSTIPNGCLKSSGTATAPLHSSQKAKSAWCRAIRMI